MKRYVLGFFYTPDGVVLIEKTKPDWQKGLVNGLGGSIEKGEFVQEAMAREFMEECGVQTFPYQWEHFATLTGKGFQLNVLRAKSKIGGVEVKSCDEGEVGIYPELPKNMETTARWLCEMASDTSFGEEVIIRGTL